jgi:hypothetical protein
VQLSGLHQRLASTDAELKRVEKAAWELRRRAEGLEHERDAIQQRLDESLKQRLSTGQFVTNDTSKGPGAEEYFQDFNHVCTQTLRTFASALAAELDRARVPPSPYMQMLGISRKQFVRNLLARNLFSGDPPDTTSKTLLNNFAIPLSEEMLKNLQTLAKECGRLVRNAENARPRATLIIPRRGVPFDSMIHLPTRDSADGPGATVELLLSPGYSVDSPEFKVRVQAEVLAIPPKR